MPAEQQIGDLSQTANRVLASLAARRSFGRLVAYLAAKTRDVGLAEELMADALAKALEAWPVSGVPIDPTAWLLQVARRRFIDSIRRNAVASEAAQHIQVLFDQLEPSSEDAMQSRQSIPDDRLKLLFVCAHPSIDESARSPLMLQVVFGFNAASIGALFVTSSKTMGQRLVRAKNKIREAGLRFEVPQAPELADRVDAVLDALYGAFAAAIHHGNETLGGDVSANELIDELLWLTQLIDQLLPNQPEVQGLLALMLHIQARGPSAGDSDGPFIPLDARDASGWSKELIAQGDAILMGAAASRQFGRYQLEAAIQSVHNARARTGITDWSAVLVLYEALCAHWPTVGSRVAHMAAVFKAGDAETALRGLDLVAATVPSHLAYQPYWATRAAVLAALGQSEQARYAYEVAIGLTPDPRVRAFLHQQAEQVQTPNPGRKVQ